MRLIGLDELQREVREWADYNFPERKPYQAVLGIAEEVGELAEALTGLDRSAMQDAVGDIVIYAANHAINNEYELLDAQNLDGSLQAVPASPGTAYRRIAVVAGQICHAQLKGEQKIRGSAAEHAERAFRAVGQLLNALEAFCYVALLPPAHECAAITWENVVKKRNWPGNPRTGTAAA